MVGAIGLEPTTPTMSRWCSNQLSYAPAKWLILQGFIIQHHSHAPAVRKPRGYGMMRPHKMEVRV